MRWLFAAALALVLCSLGAVFAFDLGGSAPAAEPTPSSVVWGRPTPSISGEPGYVPTFPQTATPSPAATPTALDPLPVARWMEIDPLDTMDAGTGDFFVLDTETGKMYSPIPELPDQRTQVSIGWLPGGQAIVGMYGSGREYPDDSIAYAGDLFGEMYRLPGRYINVSSKGIGAYDTDEGTFLYDVAGRRDLGAIANRPLGNAGEWSPDGRYLSFHAGNSLLKQRTQTAIWDRETETVVAIVPATAVTWIDDGSEFLYGAVDPDDPDERIIETRAYDIESGTERLVSSDALSDPSPGGEYALGTSYREWDKRHSFSMYSTSTGRKLITLMGSWPMRWIDSDTIGFMGGVCGPSSYFTVNVDGTDLRRYTDFDWATVAHPSPGGDKYAFTIRDDHDKPGITTIVDTIAMTSRSFPTGGVALPPYAMSSDQWWSADGRYVLLHNRGGRDGPCFETQPQTFDLIKHP